MELVPRLPAFHSDWDLRTLTEKLVKSVLHLIDLFPRLLRWEKSRIKDELIFVLFRQTVVLLVELRLQDVSRYERCLVGFLTDLVPVNTGKPSVLLHFSDRLRPLRDIFSEQTLD